MSKTPDRAKSVPIPEYVFDVLPTLKDGEKLALIAIARLTFGAGLKERRITVTELAEASSLTRKGAGEAAISLEERGLIEREHLGKGPRSGISYKLVMPDFIDCSIECDRAA